MAFTRVNLMHVERLCGEIKDLTQAVRTEMNEDEQRMAAAGLLDIADHAAGSVPYTAHASMTTGELRRRSMDLTRALSQLRSPLRSPNE